MAIDNVSSVPCRGKSSVKALTGRAPHKERHGVRAAKGFVILLVSGLLVHSYSAEFHLDPKTDAWLGVTGLAAAAGGEVSINVADGSSYSTSPTQVDRLDRWALMPYERGSDIAGDLTAGAAILAPALLGLRGEEEDFLTYGVMYAETVCFTLGAVNILKSVVPRYRPFTYYNNAPRSLYQADDFIRSFPSSHTAFAFAGASFLSFVYSKDFPQSPWKLPLIASCFTLAAATGVLRVTSGNHFPTDVLAGAAIGSAAGILVPMAHLEGKGSEQAGVSGISFSLVPTGNGIAGVFAF